MKILFLVMSLIGYAFAVCPFELLLRSGHLDSETVAKFNALKNDPNFKKQFAGKSHAEHQRVSDTPNGAKTSDGLLNLPIGSRSCKKIHPFSREFWNAVATDWLRTSEWRLVPRYQLQQHVKQSSLS